MTEITRQVPLSLLFIFCSACPQNASKLSTGPGECVPCPPGSMTYIEGSAQCVCGPGFTKSENGSCSGRYLTSIHFRIIISLFPSAY